jgi:hypothetical protein
MLARLDLDPWQEAARLARMSKATATARLTELIRCLPDEPTAGVPVETVAGDLVALLPNISNFVSQIPDKRTKLGFSAKVGIGLGALALLIFVVMLFSGGRPLWPGSADAPTASPEAGTTK